MSWLNFLAFPIGFALLCLIYVSLFGNTKFHRDGCIGRIYRFMASDLISAVHRFSLAAFPEGFFTHTTESCIGVNGLLRYVLVLFDLVLYVIYGIAFFGRCYPHIAACYPDSYHIHIFVLFTLIPCPWIVILAFQFVDPGEITPENVDSYLNMYPYDNVLYVRRTCPTLNIPVPARSRFCRFSRRRIARYDHYCPWVIAPVGLRTQRLFLCYLLALLISAVYYSTNQIHFFIWFFRERQTTLNSFREIILFLAHEEPGLFMTTVMLVFTSLTTAYLLVHQCWCISRNRTQIEVTKIDALREIWVEGGKGDLTYKNLYDRGFLENWKEILFPAAVESADEVGCLLPDAPRKGDFHKQL
jgi:palmitoyltransferase